MTLSRLPWAPLALAFVLAQPARAGDWHVGATLACGDCHVIHNPKVLYVAVEPSDVGSNKPGKTARELRVGPLLKEDINDLCLSCHDGTLKAPDVLGTNQGKAPSAVRQAGYLNRLGGSGYSSTGHTLGSSDPAPGADPPWSPEDEGAVGGLDCIHCHAPHGSREAYRNLRADAGNNRLGEGLVTYNGDRPGLLDGSRDVFLRRTLDYDESAVDFNEPDARDSAIARFCAGCHGEFHGLPGGKQIGGYARRAGLQSPSVVTPPRGWTSAPSAASSRASSASAAGRRASR